MGVLISVLVFGLVVMIHEFGHFAVAKICGIKVNEFSIGMGPKIFGKKKGDTEYNLRALPIGGFVAMEGEDEGENMSEGSFNSVPVQSRILVVIAGAVMNMILGFAVLLFLVSGEDAITSRKVKGFYENAKTYETGLREDDEIVAINGRKCYIADDIIYEFARTENASADFTIIRDGKKIQLKGVTFDTVENDDGTSRMIIDFYVYPVEKTVHSVVREAANWTISLARTVFLSLIDLVTGHVAINQMSGPVGIVSTISEAVSYGYESVLLILAMITINLGVFNLMPFPALDGGRLLFLLIELLRGKPLNPKYEMFVNARGMIILLGFMAFVTFSDITKLFI